MNFYYSKIQLLDKFRFFIVRLKIKPESKDFGKHIDNLKEVEKP